MNRNKIFVCFVFLKGPRLGLEAKKKKNTDWSLEENPKDNDSILWWGSLKVAIGKENAGEILYPLEENIFPLKDGHS